MSEDSALIASMRALADDIFRRSFALWETGQKDLSRELYRCAAVIEDEANQAYQRIAALQSPSPRIKEGQSNV
jgi:hypothetical protein